MEANAITGTCMLMCPIEETTFRETEGLLHRLELSDCEKIKRLPTADPQKTIKCFTRSAAGLETPPAHLLRPGPILLQTVRYLMQEIAPLEARRIDVYEFITDRLRAVRQDMTIQRLQPRACIPILQPMIRFHVLFGYLLSNHPRFDFHLNNIHLQECFGTILKCYECVLEEVDENILEIYMCCNINVPEMAVKRLHGLSETMNLDVIAAAATGNFMRLCRLALQRDVLARAAFAFHVPKLRQTALKNLCKAMSSANASYSIERLTSVLSYSATQEALEDCCSLGIKYSETHCHFNKKELVTSASPPSCQKWWAVDKDLKSAGIAQLILK